MSEASKPGSAPRFFHRLLHGEWGDPRLLALAALSVGFWIARHM